MRHDDRQRDVGYYLDEIGLRAGWLTAIGNLMTLHGDRDTEIDWRYLCYLIEHLLKDYPSDKQLEEARQLAGMMSSGGGCMLENEDWTLIGELIARIGGDAEKLREDAHRARTTIIVYPNRGPGLGKEPAKEAARVARAGKRGVRT